MVSQQINLIYAGYIMYITRIDEESWRLCRPIIFFSVKKILHNIIRTYCDADYQNFLSIFVDIAYPYEKI